MKDFSSMLDENHPLKRSAGLVYRLVLMALLALGIPVASSGNVLANSSLSVGGPCSMPGATAMDANGREVLGCFSGFWQRGRTGVINLNTIPSCGPGHGLNFDGRSFICVAVASEPVNGGCNPSPGFPNPWIRGCISGNVTNLVVSNNTAFDYVTGNGIPVTAASFTYADITATWDCEGGGGGTSQTGCTFTASTCAPQSVSWAVGGYTCSGTTGLMEEEFTGTVIAGGGSSPVGSTVGTAQYTCNPDGSLRGPSMPLAGLSPPVRQQQKILPRNGVY